MHVDDRWSPLLPADEDEAPTREYVISAKVWRWKGDSGFHFATVPEAQGQAIRQRFGKSAKGWGSIKVRVTIGDTEWPTSLFPHKEANSYVFAIKAEVRKSENIRDGDTITATLHIA